VLIVKSSLVNNGKHL